MFPQQYCLRWKYHHSNLQTMFSQLLERQAYCDVTLACEGKTLRAHKGGEPVARRNVGDKPKDPRPRKLAPVYARVLRRKVRPKLARESL